MKLNHILTLCFLLVLLASCRKEEFMPEPEGEKVPYSEINTSLKQAITASPYTIFKAAWERSNLDKILKEKNDKTPFTVLVPTDEAFIADGLTLEKIKQTEPALLDSILLYHVLTGNYNPDDFIGREDNFMAKSLLQNSFLKVKPVISGASLFDPYFYIQALKLAGKSLFINGKAAGEFTPTQTKNGVLWPINKVLHQPRKTILQVLEEDGRFGMYLELNERADAWYQELTSYIIQRNFKDGMVVADIGYYNITFSSIFAITDDAFHQAGFETVDELMELNNRNPLPYVDWDTYSVKGGFATDTLIGYHRWGTSFAPYDPSYGGGVKNISNFYTNDLNNVLLSDYTLVTAGFTSFVSPYIMPLDFGKEAGQVTVKVKGSDYPPAKIIEGDINTLMGPVHIVDRLILPRGFKL
ncbi:fasciclin domain-containing protein [Pedobacter gandavensis]|uniref:fasciclin domain-containing protein n=1 Tax=Pedobacter gandavensis TaxID=2679963 RepID=UPI0029301536|nr:fasciclin domain-containing protein [Pedobacter gandavensis]